jgi:hypothetical protein
MCKVCGKHDVQMLDYRGIHYLEKPGGTLARVNIHVLDRIMRRPSTGLIRATVFEHSTVLWVHEPVDTVALLTIEPLESLICEGNI